MAVHPGSNLPGRPEPTGSAWAVHVFTASGAVLALLAASAVIESDFRGAFLWLFAATVIDTIDGWLARRARVDVRIPWFDGAKLDGIVDYLTFVFVPVLLIRQAGLLPARTSLAVACAVLLASAYGFNRADAKSDDHFFTGFPSYWNIVAFYLYVWRLPGDMNALILIALAVLVFVPVGYIYPSRTPAFRSLTLGMGVGWGALMLVLIQLLPDVPPGLMLASLVFPAYYAVLSVVLHRRRRPW